MRTTNISPSTKASKKIPVCCAGAAIRWHSLRDAALVPLQKGQDHSSAPRFCDTGVGISVSSTTCEFSLGSAPASLTMREYEKWRWETKRTLNLSPCPYPNLALSSVASAHLPPAQGTALSQRAEGITAQQGWAWRSEEQSQGIRFPHL